MHDAGILPDDRPYLVMELCPGGSLTRWVKRDERPDPERVREVGVRIADALAAAHERGVLHRDVKPSNILLTPNDFVYLVDFGIASRSDGTEPGLTAAGMTIGTWAYMAPERITTAESDARADIYALACVLYECLTGSQPFPGNSLEQQIGGHLSMPPPTV